jgi:hypothetical protein
MAATIASVVLAVALAIYIFLPSRSVGLFTRKTRLDYLEERKEVLYEDLRDLNFEFKAGKYPPEDYAAQRSVLEDEAAVVLDEMERLRFAGR